MRYILLTAALLFLTACAPRYRTTYQYLEPKNPEAATCVHRCKEALSTCREVCRANFEICNKKAEKIGKANYDKKLQRYYRELEAYANRVQMYNLKRDLFYYNDFYYGGRYGFYGPFGGRLLWGPPPVVYTIPKPVKPSLQQENLKAQMKHCRIDCGCLQSYDRCFEGCGGKIETKKICIQNCPR